MAPVELEYSINGESKKKVIVKNGLIASINTPVGIAFAEVQPQGENWLTRCPVIDRLGTKFPSDPEYVRYSTDKNGLHYHINTIFDPLFPKERKLRKAKKIFRKKNYITEEGEVTIKATGYDKE